METWDSRDVHVGQEKSMGTVPRNINPFGVKEGGTECRGGEKLIRIVNNKSVFIRNEENFTFEL